MATVYSIALRVPEESQAKIKTWYKDAYHREVAVRTLHCSVIFSFSDEEKDTRDIIEIVQQFQFQPFTLTLEKPIVFTATGNALVALTFDEASTKLLHRFHEVFEKHLELNLGKPVAYDVSIFTDGILPTYEPHVSLEYNIEEAVVEKILQSGKQADISFPITDESFIVFENKSGILREHPVPKVSMPEWQ